jgi:hypothetical protein
MMNLITQRTREIELGFGTSSRSPEIKLLNLPAESAMLLKAKYPAGVEF